MFTNIYLAPVKQFHAYGRIKRKVTNSPKID
jgi:hypothetical protein